MFDNAYENAGLAKASQLCSAAGMGAFIPPSTRQRLEQKKQIIEAELAKVNAALAALDKNPDLEKFMEVIKAASV